MSVPVRVLVAENDRDTRRGLEQLLLEESHDVDAASGGIEAAEKLDTKDYDIVVSDLAMPLVNGMDLLRMAKAKRKDIVFVMTSAYGSLETASAAMELGASDFLFKPFSPSRLKGAIKDGLKRKGSGPTLRDAGEGELPGLIGFASAEGGIHWETVKGWMSDYGTEAALSAARSLGGLRPQAPRLSQ